MMNPPQARPRRRVAGIFLDALQIQVACNAPLRRIVTELVAAQKILITCRAGRHIAAQQLLLVVGQRQRQ